MAKEYKDWEKTFSRDQVEACRAKWAAADSVILDDTWYDLALTEMGYDTSITMGDIRYAVYEAPGAEDWQLFRTSMKKLSTKEKVAMLYRRWNVYQKFKAWRSYSVLVEQHRIWNYLGALHRGGFLKKNAAGVLTIHK